MFCGVLCPWFPTQDHPISAAAGFARFRSGCWYPNVITLLAICAGLTAIGLSIEGRNELALAAIVFAAVLDGIDGRVARMIKGQSRFGAELDSLADFVNFGVAPALILYFWQLHDLNNVGWIAAMIFAISGGLRLARFNATMDDPNKPPFAANYFTGVPAPAGAICVLLPMYLVLIGAPQLPAAITAVYTLTIAFLMVSRLPVFPGKMLGAKVAPRHGAACGRSGCPVYRCSDQLPVASFNGRFASISGFAAYRLEVLSRARAPGSCCGGDQVILAVWSR